MLSTQNEINILKKGKLNIKIFSTIEQMGIAASNEVANKIRELLRQKSEINMIFAAAPSQDEFFSHLIHEEQIDWTKINAFHMDEYIGIRSDASQSFARFLRLRIFDKVPFKTVNYLDGCAENIEKECERYSNLLVKYPVDIVCLGIGENGHIAFNDPGVADFNDLKLVKSVRLDHMCRQQQVNEKCFDTLDKVPQKALTLTIPALLKANWMFCIVPFANKANAVFDTLYGDVSERCPATILREKDNSFLYLEPNSAKLINKKRL